MSEPLTAEDIDNVREVLASQVRLGHAMTLVPTDVLGRLLDAARLPVSGESERLREYALTVGEDGRLHCQGCDGHDISK